jgi:hypothetical protein
MQFSASKTVVANRHAPNCLTVSWRSYRSFLQPVSLFLLTCLLMACAPAVGQRTQAARATATPAFKPIAGAVMDPCQLVLIGEAEALLGGAPFPEPIRDTYQPVAGEEGRVPSVSCTYLRESAEGVGVVAVFLITQPLSAEELWLLVRDTPGGVEPLPVAGVGDVAFWESNPGAPEEAVLSLLHESTALIVQIYVSGLDNATMLSHATQLGLQALERLER